MASSAGGNCGRFFLIVNAIIWLIGCGTLGYGIWNMVTGSHLGNFLSGTLVFTYSFLGIGLLLVIIGLLGCIGGCTNSTCCLKAYVGLMTTVLLIDIGLGIAGAVEKDHVFHIMDNLWKELNEDTKSLIQKELKCCGYQNKEEYKTNIPASCYANSIDVSTIFQSDCHTEMKTWVQSKIPIWASVIASVGFVQIVSLIASCLTLKNIEDTGRVSPLSD